MKVHFMTCLIVRIFSWTRSHSTDPRGSLEQHQLSCVEYGICGDRSDHWSCTHAMGLPPALRDHARALSGFRIYGSQHPELVWYVENYTSIICKTVGLMIRTTVYGFLDPAKGTGRLAAYIVGIAVGGIVLFVIMWAVTKLRDWIFRQGRGVKVIDLSELQSEKTQTIRV
jgi:hypothetical protein